MPAKKGVSAQEKRDRMVAMFHRSRSVYTRKEIDKSAVKEGIVSGAVEGVLKEVVGDDLVHEAKISGSLFYWSFPWEISARKRSELSKAENEVERQRNLIQSLRDQSEKLRKAHGQSEEEAATLKNQEGLLVQIRKAESEKRAEIERLRKASGSNLHLRKKDLPVLKDAANRWTDNLFQLRKHLVENCSMEPRAVDESLGTDKMDFIE